MQTTFLPYLLQASGCLAVLYLLYRLLLHRETFFAFNRWYLLGSLVLSAALPLVEIPLQREVVAISLPSVPMRSIMLPVAAPSRVAATSPGWLPWVGVVYGLGAAAALARLVHQLVQLVRLKNRLPGQHRGNYRLILTNGQLPTCSFFTWIFWDSSLPLSEEQQNQVLRHELTHIRQRHWADVLLVELAGVFCWFNPAIYLLKRDLQTVHEYLADRETVASGSPEGYIHLMAARLLHRYPPTVSQPFNGYQLKSRIYMLRKYTHAKPAFWKMGTSLLMALLISGLYACRTSETTPATRNTSPTGAATELEQYLAQYPGISADIHFFNPRPHPTLRNETVHDVEAEVLGVDNEADRGRITALINQIYATAPSPNISARLRINRASFHEGDRNSPVATQLAPTRAGATANTPTGPAVRGNDTAPGKPENMPEFAGGMPQLKHYLEQNLRYPRDARKNKIEGTVFIAFVIGADGSVSDVQLSQGVGYGCDEEAIRLVQNMPKWVPAQREGKRVSTRYALPIRFCL